MFFADPVSKLEANWGNEENAWGMRRGLSAVKRCSMEEVMSDWGNLPWDTFAGSRIIIETSSKHHSHSNGYSTSCIYRKIYRFRLPYYLQDFINHQEDRPKFTVGDKVSQAQPALASNNSLGTSDQHEWCVQCTGDAWFVLFPRPKLDIFQKNMSYPTAMQANSEIPMSNNNTYKTPFLEPRSAIAGYDPWKISCTKNVL